MNKPRDQALHSALTNKIDCARVASSLRRRSNASAIVVLAFPDGSVDLSYDIIPGDDGDNGRSMRDLVRAELQRRFHNPIMVSGESPIDQPEVSHESDFVDEEPTTRVSDDDKN